MGYTHYFGLKPRHKRTGVKKLQVEIQKVLDQHKDIISYESDDSRPPINEVTDNEILVRFNGKDFDNGHETFYFDSSEQSDEFCKTTRKSYDVVVCKVLMLLKGFYGTAFDLRSDGFSNNQPKDKYYEVGNTPRNSTLDENWGWVWNWFNNILPFGKPIRFSVVKVYGHLNCYFRVAIYKG